MSDPLNAFDDRSSDGNSSDTDRGSDRGSGSERNLGRRVFFIVVGLAVAVIAYLIGAAVLPRWWAQRMGDLIDGRLVFGNMLGFSMGLIFTVLPLFVLAAGWRFKKTWKRAIGFVLAALVVAAPNLLTLGIVIGTGNAAHAGERILDVDGPGFRGGSLVGAIVGAVLAAGVLWLMGSRRRNKRKAKQLEVELDARS